MSLENSLKLFGSGLIFFCYWIETVHKNIKPDPNNFKLFSSDITVLFIILYVYVFIWEKLCHRKIKMYLYHSDPYWIETVHKNIKPDPNNFKLFSSDITVLFIILYVYVFIWEKLCHRKIKMHSYHSDPYWIETVHKNIKPDSNNFKLFSSDITVLFIILYVYVFIWEKIYVITKSKCTHTILIPIGQKLCIKILSRVRIILSCFQAILLFYLSYYSYMSSFWKNYVITKSKCTHTILDPYWIETVHKNIKPDPNNFKLFSSDITVLFIILYVYVFIWENYVITKSKCTHTVRIPYWLETVHKNM